MPLCLAPVLPPTPVPLPDPHVPPVLLLSFIGFRLVKEGLLPCVGPAPGIGRRLRGIPLPAALPVVGTGMPRPPRLGVFAAAPLIEEDDVSRFILLDEAWRGVVDPDLGVDVPDLGVVPPDETRAVAEEGDNSNGLPFPSKGIN